MNRINITGLYLKRYQSIRAPVWIKLSDLTILVGPNSAGKSTVLDALNAMKLALKNGGYFEEGGSVVGLEFEVLNTQNIVYDWNSPDDPEGEHVYFLKSLEGHTVRYVFCESEISLSVDGICLFEVENRDKRLGDEFYGKDLHGLFARYEQKDEEWEDYFLESGFGFYLSTSIKINRDYDLLNAYRLAPMALWDKALASSRRKSDLIDYLYDERVENSDYDESYGLDLSYNPGEGGIFTPVQLDYTFMMGGCGIEWRYYQGGGRDLYAMPKISPMVWEEDHGFIRGLAVSKKKRDRLHSEFCSTRTRGRWYKVWRDYFSHLNSCCHSVTIVCRRINRLLLESFNPAYHAVKNDRGLIRSGEQVYFVSQAARWGDSNFYDATVNPGSEGGQDETLAELCRGLMLKERRFSHHIHFHTTAHTDSSIDKDREEIKYRLGVFRSYLSEHVESLKGYKLEADWYDYVGPDKLLLIDGDKPGKKTTGSKYTEVRAITGKLLIRNPAGLLLGLENVGTGISFMLPILAGLTYRSFLYVEQPELHLHPQSQCEIADVFIDAQSRGVKSIVETHSEYFILRLLRRIRETSRRKRKSKKTGLKARDLLIYFFEPKEDGSTSIHAIRVDDDGELLDPWPGGFFTEREKELFS